VPNRRPKFTGPFLGLNTTLTPRDLDARWAVDAQNVLLSDGRVRPAWPLSLWGGTDPEAAWPAVTWQEGWVSPMGNQIHWDSPKVGEIIVFQSYLQDRGWRYWAAYPDGRVLDLAPSQPRPACYVPAYGRLYMLDGADPRKTDGTIEGTVLAGLFPPTGAARLVRDDNTEGWAILEEGTYEYAITYYDEEHDVESNPYNLGQIDITASEEHRAQIQVTGEPLANRHVTHWRLYRKDIHLGTPYFLLRSQRKYEAGSLYDPYGTRTDPTPAEGNTTTGPFAPSKNGVPPKATVGCVYRDRMFYNNSVTTDGRDDLLHYSAFGRPDHVDPDDYETLTGDAQSGITGMAELQKQLVLLKPKSIWVLSGTIVTSTNETIATGATAPSSSHSLGKTKATIGCANTEGGNGAIVVGEPERLHFNGEAGLYSFDGVAERNLAKNIKDTWRTFAKRRSETEGEKNQQVSYAVDTVNRILFIANGVQPWGDPEILAYHYGREGPDGVGGWTYLRSPWRARPYCSVATTLGDIHEAEDDAEATFYAPLMVACADGKIRIGNDRSEILEMPRFRYETPPLRPLDGGLAHIYQVTWLHGRVVSDDDYPRDFEFGHRAKREEQYELRRRSLRYAASQHQPISRESDEISLLVQSPSGLGDTMHWHPDMGLAGWILEFEPAGGY